MVSTLHIMSILLIVLMPLSYLPQHTKLITLQSVGSVSVTATLMLALCAQAQIPTMYYLFACPTYKRDGDIIPKPPRLMDWLNLAQLLTQWLCCLVMLGLVLAVRGPARDDAETDAATETTTGPATEQTTDPVTEPETAGTPSPSSRTALLLLAIHAILCVGWAVFAGKPTRDWLDLPFGIIMTVNYVCINPLITIATGVAYGLQAYNTSGVPPGRNNALSRATITRHIILFFALAVLWPIRFPAPLKYRYEDPWLLTGWYPLVGWACVNNALVAVGQCIVLYYFGGAAGVETQSTNQETQPLMGA